MTLTTTTWANKVSGQFEKDMAHAVGLFSEYLEFASYADADAKGRMPWDLDYHYLLNNTLNGLWQAIYGNTTNTNGNDQKDAQLGNDYFKAVHVRARAHRAFMDYRNMKPYTDETSERFDAVEAANDLTFCNITTAYDAANNRFNALEGMLNAHRTLFNSLFDEAWNYQPYTVNEAKVSRQPSEQQKRTQARLAAMANKTAA